jgi:L-fuconolactonase
VRTHLTRPRRRPARSRHVVHDEPDDLFMLGADFQRGIGALAEFGLAYDLLLFPRHLPVAVQLARAFPAQVFVLDHIAKPRIGGALEPWLSDLAALAACQNVSVKLSGMVTEAAPGWAPADFLPYLEAVLSAFGPDRVMVGSDWPVVLLNADSYGSAMGIVSAWLATKDAGVAAAIRTGNAERIYKLRA